MAPIPVTVIGGYLGAGKTTLVNHLLRHADGERIAVLVNDFGDINIDADLIESREGDLINLAGGCICCSFGSDLVEALARLPAMPEPPERILIETSGVALPRTVARTLTLVRGLAADAVVVLVDALSVREQADDRYVADTVLGQLRDADLLLLSKGDLAGPGHDTRLRDWLLQVAPGKPVIDTVRGAVARELLFGLAQRRERSAFEPRPLGPGAPTTADFAALSWVFEAPLDPRSLCDALSRLQAGVVRAKGVVSDYEGQQWLLQMVGERIELDPAPAHATAAASAGTLVLLGPRATFDPAQIGATLSRIGGSASRR